MNKNIKIILGSVRTNRAGKAIADWVVEESSKYNGNLSFEFIDLQELNLPFVDEPVPAMQSSDYVQEHTRAWSEKITASDGFVFVTPEYNHGYSPVLKNALDYLYNEWREKPAGFVGYGSSGARLSIGQLKQVMDFIGFTFVEEQVGVEKIWEAVDETGKVKETHVSGDIQKLFAQLEGTLG